jgi:hypothetical protein
MESTIAVVSEEKKSWTCPELKMQDVDGLTAAGGGPSPDSDGKSS